MISSYNSEKTSIRNSKINGKGVFANEKIRKGEIVFVKSGYIVKKEQVFSSKCINSYLPLSDELYLSALNKDDEERIKLYINHSCDPNCGLRGEITFVAIRDIEIGEEITFDYAFVDNEDYTFRCNCGAKDCRKIVTGFDWKIKELQDKYFDYFAAYLKEKIKHSRQNK